MCRVNFAWVSTWPENCTDTYKDAVTRDGDGSGIVTSGCMLLEGAITDSNDLMDTELRRLITTQMRRDQRSKAAKEDKLIVLFAEALLRKVGPNMANDIKQRMRQLGVSV